MMINIKSLPVKKTSLQKIRLLPDSLKNLNLEKPRMGLYQPGFVIGKRAIVFLVLTAELRVLSIETILCII